MPGYQDNSKLLGVCACVRQQCQMNNVVAYAAPSEPATLLLHT